MNIGLIEGGRAPNVIPDHAVANLLIRLVGPTDELRQANYATAVAGKAEANFILEIPFMELGTVPGIDTMIAAFTTDIPALAELGNARADRARLHSCGAHRRRTHPKEAVARRCRSLRADRAPPAARRLGGVTLFATKSLALVQAVTFWYPMLWPRTEAAPWLLQKILSKSSAILAAPQILLHQAWPSSSARRYGSSRGSELFDLLEACDFVLPACCSTQATRSLSPSCRSIRTYIAPDRCGMYLSRASTSERTMVTGFRWSRTLIPNFSLRRFAS